MKKKVSNKISIYYFPRIRNFGIIKRIRGDVLEIISPYYDGDNKTIMRVKSDERREIINYANNDNILFVDGQMFIDTSSDNIFICRITKSLSLTIFKSKKSYIKDCSEFMSMVETNNDKIEVAYEYKGNFEQELTSDKMMKIFTLLGSGTGNIEIKGNIFQLDKNVL